jgi:hypothetical protein
VNPERDLTVPVAIILSDQQTGQLWFRLPREGEQIEGVSLGEIMPYLELARDQIVAWQRADTLPYAPQPLAPLSAAWWTQVRRLMRWRVQLDPTRPIDCRCAEEELEPLYEAWVRPSLAGKRHVCPESASSGSEPSEPEEAVASLPVSTVIPG